MNRLLQDTANLFDVAMAAAHAGQPPGDTAVLIGADNSIRVVCGSGWTAGELRRLHGTSHAYRVSHNNGNIRVTGETGSHRCLLEAESSGRRTVERLLGLPRQLRLNPPAHQDHLNRTSNSK